MALLSLIGPATKLIGKFIEDKDAKNKLDLKLLKRSSKIEKTKILTMMVM